MHFCTERVGDRWAKESLLKMTETVNLASGFKEKTVWHGEACVWRPLSSWPARAELFVF